MLDDRDRDELLAAVRRLHEDVRARVGALLAEARRSGRRELTTRPGAWGAGDLAYALDEAADEALAGFGAALGGQRPVVLVDEDKGVRRFGPHAPPAPAAAAGGPRTAATSGPAPGGPRTAATSGSAPPGAPSLPAVRVLIDPVDGTRSLMHDMRSAWVVTAVAPDKGDATRLSDAEIAVQTELPTTSAGRYDVLWAARGRGACIARHDVGTGAELERSPLRADEDDALENGYLSFTRFLPVERPLVAALEERFLSRAIAAHGLQPRLLYDDQYLSNAGQLYWVTRGRYRMLADLRGWLRRVHGLANFTSKPYDLAALLVYTEAGVPVLDELLAPLDAPMDTTTPLSIVAFANETVARRLRPHLEAAMEDVARPDGAPPGRGGSP